MAAEKQIMAYIPEGGSTFPDLITAAELVESGTPFYIEDSALIQTRYGDRVVFTVRLGRPDGEARRVMLAVDERRLGHHHYFHGVWSENPNIVFGPLRFTKWGRYFALEAAE